MTLIEKQVLLSARRLPGRLSTEEAGVILGFLSHEITILMRAGLLKPLGRPAPNGHKFFSATEIQELANDRDWLDKATKIIQRNWREKNREEVGAES